MAEKAIPLDSNWLRAHPLTVPSDDADKNDRGRVLVIGGSRFVPGGIALTAEAALRAGAGKVQVATIRSVALALGMAMPEIGVIGLDETEEGEIIVDPDAIGRALSSCDAVVAGPAMVDAEAGLNLIDALTRWEGSGEHHPAIILDSAALLALPGHAAQIRQCKSPIVLTPHIGELAAMLECKTQEANCPEAVSRASTLFGATVVLKGPTSIIASPDGMMLSYAGGGVGLATGGSGDALAGIVGGLAARGAAPLEALAWAVWLHGEAGRRCAEEMGPIGFLSRELLAKIPLLMRGM